MSARLAARVLCASLLGLGLSCLNGLLAEERPEATNEPAESPEPTEGPTTASPETATPEQPGDTKPAEASPFRTRTSEGRLVITTADDEPVATYVFADEQILRPYFMHVHTPDGTPVTRHHPPREGMELTDHATMHPGIWLGFGDLSGADFWRNKGRVEHVEFVEEPTVEDGVLRFAVRNRYVSGEKTVCQEVCRHTLRRRNGSYVLTYDSTFTDENTFVFGDQEEMGLGVRVAGPLRVRAGNGRIVNAEGMTNEEQVWGKPSPFCAYQGEIDGRQVGLLLVPHPENFRPSWFHARDYGFLAANPFGRKSFMAGEPSKVTVKPGEAFRLRFGIVAFALPSEAEFDPAGEAKHYVECVAAPKEDPADAKPTPPPAEEAPPASAPAEKPTTEKPTTEKPTTEKPTTENPAAEKDNPTNPPASTPSVPPASPADS